ncbi:MAG: LamG domain-containing protein, partial [Planctomycetaceae bacterium]|nr:LamG domain-containing protein [Planctomycetaceae bacterium]
MNRYGSLMLLVLLSVVSILEAGIGAIQDKTLVAWVRLGNLDQRGSGVLTLTECSAEDHFDSITYAERESGKWMAGSEYWRRTQPDQSMQQTETADQGTVVKIVIVYAGTTVSIYRNDMLYTSYSVPSTASFSSDTDVLIGLRYRGANSIEGYFCGVIEEARLYGQALDAQTAAGLAMNQMGGPQPLGCWTFEDGTTADTMGNFSPGRLRGNAQIINGGLHLDGQGYVEISNSIWQSSDKTLVAWVQLGDLEQRGSGVLTLFNHGVEEGQFDSITFGEIEPGKW